MASTATARRGGGLVGPLILIVLGSIFLASNLGFLSWNVWETIFRLWPLLLVALGLELLLGHHRGGSVWGTVLSLLIVLVVLSIAAVVAMVPTSRVTFGPESAQSRVVLGGPVHTEEISQPVGGASRADVELGLGVGDMRLSAMPEADGLIEGSLTLGENERVARDFQVRGNTAYFRMSSETGSMMFGDNDRRWDLRLNPQVPMSLKIHGGVGTGELDLSKLQVSNLEMQVGVSETTLTLPRQGRVQARVEGGVGKLTVLVPRGMATRVQVDRGLSSVDVFGNYQQRGDTYLSPGYESAQNRIDLAIKGGVGKITVQEVEAS